MTRPDGSISTLAVPLPGSKAVSYTHLAFGETLAIVMVIGNRVQIPRSLFDAAYPLPALIANAYSEMMSIPLYQSALMLASLVLMVIVLIFNIAARLTIVRLSNKG